jgi:hypothetical protein
VLRHAIVGKLIPAINSSRGLNRSAWLGSAALPAFDYTGPQGPAEA